jgi:hypothetical protein
VTVFPPEARIPLYMEDYAPYADHVVRLRVTRLGQTSERLEEGGEFARIDTPEGQAVV